MRPVPTIRAPRDRSAVIVETALIMPLLMILVLGMTELGFIARDKQTVVAASRAATRVISSSGDSRLADYDALATLSAALNAFNASDVQRIIIYKANPDGSMPTGCINGPVTNQCNHYTGADLILTPADFMATDCLGDPDVRWCPTDRETGQIPGPDWIGVRIEVFHNSFAPFVPDRTIIDSTIMRLEPRFASS